MGGCYCVIVYFSVMNRHYGTCALTGIYISDFKGKVLSLPGFLNPSLCPLIYTIRFIIVLLRVLYHFILSIVSWITTYLSTIQKGEKYPILEEKTQGLNSVNFQH